MFFSGVHDDPELRGVIPNAYHHIFQHIAQSRNQQYLVRASYLEIYQVFDIFLRLFFQASVAKMLY